MPAAVALLADPVGAYVALVVAIANLVYGAHTRLFLPLFAACAAGFLAALAFLHVAPHGLALVLLAGGVALLDAEFRFATAGTAVVLGMAALLGGSWLILSPPYGGPIPPAIARAILAVAGSALVLLTTLLGWRRATLP